MHYGRLRLLGGALTMLALGAGPAASRDGHAPVETTATSSAEAVVLAADPAPAAEPAPVPEVEPAITAPGVEGEYLRLVHSHIHWRWVHNFIEVTLAGKTPKDPLNKPALETEILFTVRWDGSAAETTVSKSSGNKDFDTAALNAIRTPVHYPVPPLELYADDGAVHLRWVLARDHRRCGEGELRRMEAPLDEALPRLFVQGRKKEALLRAVRYAREGDASAISSFARAYLALRYADPLVDVRAAAALALAGDRRQVDRLRPGLARPETVGVVATALAALKVDVCPLVRAALESKEPDPALLAARALREARAPLPDTSPCVAALNARIKDSEASSAVRADMLQTLAAVNPANVHRLLAVTLADPDAEMRAAAAAAIARPGGGRPALYRLEPLLRDPVPQVRAAAAAGMVRSTGELSFEYLRPLFKQGDIPSLIALASELGRQSSAGSADLLAKMLKRPEPELRRAVLDALAARRDAPARALFKPLAQAVKRDLRASPDARITVYANADIDELLQFSKDPVLGPTVYKALLRARRYKEALDWLVTAFDRLPPETLVDAFAAWLASPPPRMAATATSSHG